MAYLAILCFVQLIYYTQAKIDNYKPFKPSLKLPAYPSKNLIGSGAIKYATRLNAYELKEHDDHEILVKNPRPVRNTIGHSPTVQCATHELIPELENLAVNRPNNT